MASIAQALPMMKAKSNVLTTKELNTFTGE